VGSEVKNVISKGAHSKYEGGKREQFYWRTYSSHCVCSEGTWVRGTITAFILNLSSIWTWVLSFTPSLDYLCGEQPSPPLCNHLGEGEGLKLIWMLLETSFVAGEIDPWVLGCPPHSLVPMTTMLSQLCAGETSYIYIYIYRFIAQKFIEVHVGLQNCSYNQSTTLSL